MKSGFTSVSARISLTLVSFMLLASISPFALAESNKQDLSSEVMIGDLSDFEPSIEGKQYTVSYTHLTLPTNREV